MTTPRAEIESILARLEALDAAGTKGPWREGTKNVWQDGLCLMVAATERGQWEAGAYRINRGDPDTEQEDARLIAASRNALGPLIAAVKLGLELHDPACSGVGREDCPVFVRMLAALREIVLP